MVICLMKWDIRPEKIEAYQEWAQPAVKRLLVRGVTINDGKTV